MKIQSFKKNNNEKTYVQNRNNPLLRMIYYLHRRWTNLPSAKVIPLGFIGIIIVGTFLLWLPCASRSAGSVPLSDCWFTAASATCVTGLVRYDTQRTWTLFGQVVILTMIQIGGVGFMAIVLSGLVAARRRIFLHTRRLMQDSISVGQVGGIVRITEFVMKGTFLIEGIGALLLSFYFIPRLGFGKGIWYSIFHSISAFCNAGFDLMGVWEPGSSLILVKTNWYMNIVYMLLITIGGLGFLVWKDLLDNRFHFNRLRLHSKLVLVTSAVLTFGGAIAIFLLEIGSPEFEALNLKGKILVSLFQSVTCRTAGFCTLDLGAMTSAAQAFMIFLMFIGSSSGSTGGGMKTTTFVVHVLSIRAIARRRKTIEAFHRSISEETVHTASCIAALYIFSALLFALIICSIEGNITFQEAFFETVSSVATVGSTLGLTAKLSMVSKLLLTVLMIFGRSGTVTMLYALTRRDKKVQAKYPAESITIG
ncbi:MAG: potassium transporter TrkG [Eubacteriales bacterium]|nr:potassium transporter TrkG [Eubacteriales bacterium]